MSPDALVSVLEKLIDACRDGEKNYREAAEHISDPELRGFCADQCAERAQFATQLQQALHRLGKWETTRQGSVAGALQRMWSDLKSHLASGEEAVLEALDASEAAATKLYGEALREPLPEDIREVVQRQLLSISAAHDHIQLVRSRRRAA